MNKLYNLNWVDEDNLNHSKILDPQIKKLLIGRSPTADIVISNSSVSRIHAQLYWEHDVLNVKDLNSSFGTWVNDRRLSSNENKALYEKGEIRLGSLSLWYEIRDKDKSQEMLQTCLLTDSDSNKKTKLTVELSAFKEKLLKNIKMFSHAERQPELLEDSLNKEIQILCEKHQEQLKEQKILNSISHILNRTNTLTELARNALNLISKVMAADRGFLVLFDAKTETFEMLVKRNFTDSDQLASLYGYSYYSNTLVQRCQKNAQIILINDAKYDVSLSDMASIAKSATRSIAVIPLIRNEQVLGVIYLDSSSHSHCFAERHRPFLESFAAHTSIALHNVQLYKRAITDDLTQLYTRQYIDERMDQEHERAKRYLRPFSVLVVDLDHFKHINDTYGHSTGDLVLQTVSAILSQNLRDTDIAGRLGGEEFIVILGETEQTGAAIIAERIREEIENTAIEKDGLAIKVTASIGLASYQSRHNAEFKSMIEDADKALYLAKNSGRNRVVIAQ